MYLLPAVLLAAALAAWRVLAARRAERRSAARVPAGAGGIIAGAEAIALGEEGAGGGRAVLLLHGYGDTPQTLRYLAAALAARGYAVRAPLLPGHGRTLRGFVASRADEWVATAREELRAMRARHPRVGVVGLSMGGALAAVVAADDPGVAALVLLAPYLDAPPLVRALARYAPLVGAVSPYVSGRDARSIHDDAERALSLGYGATSARSLRELVTVADRARAALPRVAAPTLIVQSRLDHRVAPAVAEGAYAALRVADKRLEWLEGCGHVITVDRERDRVIALARDWLDGHLADAPTADR